MNWFFHRGPCGDGPLADPGLPRRMLRHILQGRQIGIGSRVLDVGCGRGDLLRYLDQLCLDATGLDESPDNVRAVRDRAPELNCVCGRLPEPLPFPEHHFNLVLARDVTAYDGNLLSEAAFIATARLLAVTRPGGCLLILRRAAASGDANVRAHRSECFGRHLRTFSANVEISSLASPWTDLILGHSRTFFLTSSLRLPLKEMDLRDWLAIARHATSASDAEECCARESIVRRRAA